MRINHAEKIGWIDRAVDTHNYHVRHRREDENWGIVQTARSLKRSTGSVCQDLQIASFMKTHEKEIRRCQYRKDALEFIKDKLDEMKDYTIN